MRLKDFLFVIFIFALSLLLILIWFKGGMIYGGGDVGLPTYNPSRISEVIKFVWWEVSAPGFSRPQGVSGIPFYTMLALIQKIVLSPVLLQAGLFAILIFLMGVGMYLVAKGVFNSRLWASLSAILYIFNPYMMISVWHRFVHTTIYLAAALPFLYIFWKRWIEEGSKLHLLFFLLISIFGALIFSTLGFVITVWLLFAFHLIFVLFIPLKGAKEMTIYSRRFIFGFLAWVGISLWWILPVLTAAPSIFGAQHTTSENVSTLLALSNQSNIPYSLQMINPFYLFWEADWGDIYKNKFFLILPLSLVLLAAAGFIKGFGERRYIFWSLLAFFGLVIVKGASAPFSGFLLWAFEKFFALGVLRNPFEKLGLILPFSYAILIVLGIIFLKDLIQRKILKLFVWGLLSLIILGNIFIWGFPYWQGKIFGGPFYSSKIDVPSYYNEADLWLMKQAKGGRILHLPLTVGESINYEWGYRGVEPSQLFFTSHTSISHGFNLKHVDDALKTLQRGIRKVGKIDEGYLTNLFESFNIRYVVLHKDVLPEATGVDKPERLEPILDRLSFLKKRVEFGQLIIYESEIDSPGHIYLTSGYDFLSLGKENFFWPHLLKKESNILVSKAQPETSIPSGDSTIIVSKNFFNTPPGPIIGKENILDELPAIRFLPSSPLYPLVRFKEFLEAQTVFGRVKVVMQINLSSKRLVESLKMKQSDRSWQVDKLLSEYSQMIDDIAPQLEVAFPYERPLLEAIFVRHIAVLNMLSELAASQEEQSTISNTKNNLKKHLALLGLSTFFEMKQAEFIPIFDRKVHTFTVEGRNEYEVIMTKSKGDIPSTLYFQVDNDIYQRSGENFGNFVSFGKVFLDRGYHELSYNFKKIPQDTPKFESWRKSELGEFSFDKTGREAIISSAEHEAAYLEIPLSPVIPESFYNITFDYWIHQGNGPRIQVLQDTDLIIKGKRELSLDKFHLPDKYQRYWVGASHSFQARETSDRILLKIVVEPWDDCEIIFAHIKFLCRNIEFKKKFQRPSTLAIQDLKIQRIEDENIFLRAQNGSSEIKTVKKVEFKKHSPVRYSGTFENRGGSFLVFSETFDEGWEIKLTRNGEIINPPHLLANLFANGWFLEKEGNYHFEIQYKPYDRFVKGGIFSIFSFVGILWYTLKRKSY